MKVSQLTIEWRPELPVFASDRYLRLLGERFGWLGGFEPGRGPVCVLPFVIVRTGPLRLARFPTETLPLAGGLEVEAERAFLNGVVDQLRSLGVDVIVPPTFNSLFRSYPDGARVAPYSNLIVDLTKSEDELWKAVHPKHRNVIRNAVRQGVTIRQGAEYIEQAYRLTLASFLRSSAGRLARLRVRSRLGLRQFTDLAEALGENLRVFVAESQGVAQCAAVIPWSRHSAYYMHGGSTEKPATGASNLLQWEVIRAAKALGADRYNFFGVRTAPTKGSKAEGLKLFKERFGGSLVQGYMWKIGLRSSKYALYQFAARLRNGGDVVDQESRRLGAVGPDSMQVATPDV